MASNEYVIPEHYEDLTPAPQLDQKTLNKMAWRSCFLQASFNYERMQAAGWLYSIIPGLEQLGCRCGHGHSSLVGAAAMMPRSCLEDMAWEHSGATEIGRQQVAAGGWGGAARRFVSICNSYSAKPGLTVTDRDIPLDPSLTI